MRADPKHTAFPLHYVIFALSISKTDNSRRCLHCRIYTSQPLSLKHARSRATLPRSAARPRPWPCPPSPAAGGGRRRRTRRCSPSPRRCRSPRHEDGARLTPAGSTAAWQLPPLLTSRESAHTDTSAGALGSSAATLRRKSNAYASGRSCRGALLPARSSPAAPVAPRIHAVNEEQPRETNPPFSGKIYLHSSAEPNKQGQAPAHNPLPALKAKDAESQTRRAPRLPRTARAAAGAAPPHYRITSSALCVSRLISIRNAPAMPAPHRKRPPSRRRRRGAAARPSRLRLRGIVESASNHVTQRCVRSLLNTSRHGDYTTSLEHLFQPLTDLAVENIFLMYNLNAFCLSLGPFPLVLSQ